MRKMKYNLPTGVKLEVDDNLILRRGKQDSAFYTWGNNSSVASLVYEDRRYSIECIGEMRIYYKGDVLRYTDDVINAGFTNDKKLSKLEKKGGEWVNNSWFEVFDEEAGDYTGEVYHTVQDAIETVANWIIDKEEVNA